VLRTPGSSCLRNINNKKKRFELSAINRTPGDRNVLVDVRWTIPCEDTTSPSWWPTSLWSSRNRQVHTNIITLFANSNVRLVACSSLRLRTKRTNDARSPKTTTKKTGRPPRELFDYGAVNNSGASLYTSVLIKNSNVLFFIFTKGTWQVGCTVSFGVNTPLWNISYFSQPKTRLKHKCTTNLLQFNIKINIFFSKVFMNNKINCYYYRVSRFFWEEGAANV